MICKPTITKKGLAIIKHLMQNDGEPIIKSGSYWYYWELQHRPYKVARKK